MYCFPTGWRFAAVLTILCLVRLSTFGQCTDIYDVWNGSGVFTITTRIDSSCTWEKTFEAYQTGDALRFTAVASNTYTFSVCGGVDGLDTEINIYRTTSGFPHSGYADDGCGVTNGETVLTWTPPAAGDYYLVVSLAGCINTARDMALTVRRRRLTNDICETATSISTGSTAFNSTNACGSSVVSCATANRDIWYSHTATASGLTSFSTCGASWDTHLSLWSDCQGTELACNDDATTGPCSGTTQSYFEYPLVSGVTYYIRVSGYNNTTGSGNLVITPPPPGSDPGEDCSNPFVGSDCNEAYLNQTTIGLTNAQSTRTCGSGSYPGEDAYYAFGTSEGDASRLRVTLKNVSDANDATVEVILMSGTCNAPACTETATFDIATGTFSQGLEYYDFAITPLGSAGLYYVVIDSRVDGIDAFDLYLDCFQANSSPNTACDVDDTNTDGVVTTWNGSLPPATVGEGQRRQICHEVLINGSGAEGLNAVRVDVSECLGSIGDFTANGSDNGFYGLGNWTVDSVVDQRIYWNFKGGVNRCSGGLVDVAVDITTDNWGSECLWKLVPAGENCTSPSVIFSGGNTANISCGGGGAGVTPSGGYANNSTISEGYWCLSPGSYSIKYIDSYGDGGASFDVYLNQAASYAYTPSASADSATWTFSVAESAIPSLGDVVSGGGSYSCNSYTFCYEATVLDAGTACNFTDSIQDIITLFDNGEPVAGQSNQSSWFTRMSGGDATVLPIELLDFRAYWDQTAVQVEWRTATELGTSHFELERSAEGSGNWERIGVLPAAGNSTQVRSYRHTDFTASPGPVYYRLRSVDDDESAQLHGPVFVRVPLLAEASIQVYPNPVSGPSRVMIGKAVPEGTGWIIRNAQGFPLRRGDVPSGNASVVFPIDWSNLAAGVYLLHVDGFPPLRVLHL